MSRSSTTAVLWHSFSRGRDGYCTDARSPGMPEHLASALERYSWGQARSGRYHATLDVEPAFWIEPIDDFVAVTRIFSGDVDQAGRSTFRFFSLVVERSLFRRIFLPRLSAILRRHEIWRPTVAGEVGAVIESLETDGRRAGGGLDRLSAILNDDPMAASVVVKPGAIDLDDACELLRRVDESNAPLMTVAFRSLSDAIGCGLVVLDDEASPEPSKFRRITVDAEFRRIGDEPGVRLRDRHAVRRSETITPNPFVQLKRDYRFETEPKELEVNAKTISAFLVIAACVVSFGVANLWFASKSAEAGSADLRDRVANLESKLAMEAERRRAELAAELKADIAGAEAATAQKLGEIFDSEKTTRETLASLVKEHGAAVDSSGKSVDRLTRSVAGIDGRVESVDSKIVSVERRFSERIASLAQEITQLRSLQQEALEVVVALKDAETSADSRPSKPSEAAPKSGASTKKTNDKPTSDKSKEKKP